MILDSFITFTIQKIKGSFYICSNTSLVVVFMRIVFLHMTQLALHTILQNLRESIKFANYVVNFVLTAILYIIMKIPCIHL